MPASFCVITPSFAQGRFIARTIESVLAQNVPGLDFFVVDGGSKDETVAILERYRDRLRFVSEPDRGQTDAVNKGLRGTDAPLIGWLNSDDIYYPDALATVIAYFEAHPEVDVVYGRGHHIDVHDRVLEDYPTEDWNLARLAETCFFCQPAVFFRRRVVERFGLLNENLRFCMDYDYWLRLGRRGAVFAHIPKVLAGSRFYAETKTLGQRLAVHAEINDMLKGHFGRVPNRWLSNYAHVATEQAGITADDRTRFLATLLWHTARASVRWNAWPDAELRRWMWEWSVEIAGRAGFRRSRRRVST